MHKDIWQGLNKQNSIVEKLRYMHSVMQLHMPYLSRVAVALYDESTDLLKTYAYSSSKASPLTNYQAKLSDCFSLVEIAKSQQPRLVQDLTEYADSDHQHTQTILNAGYMSSYTLPMFWEGILIGFVFFNAEEKDAFQEAALHELDAIAHMITLVIYNEISSIKTLTATVKSALQLTHSRDPETGFHLERMSRYARLIAKKISDDFQFDDQFIEHIFLFAPLHDLGKLSIPDNILLKKGPLTEDEKSIMQTHSERGKELIDKLLENYGLTGITHVDMLRNIALYHHESMDGKGYPSNLEGESIPIEARIIAVADIFDALTSHRPYKEAWSNKAAFQKLRNLAGIKLDAACVDALLRSEDEILQIQGQYGENEFG
ncbi:HD domain-containing phosphohydrolase [Aliikangiella sp. G2MR2-5]|uniref:HD domain-containing phosphohydrolase n=1 Tax=Aliikangiella sp. G2MR2-5 TaxID=2788943 RepID=UPI001FEE1B77|nr:HD domain-containing phosphohydrolase [Aliikangiella sp. G2MR2-5]